MRLHACPTTFTVEASTVRVTTLVRGLTLGADPAEAPGCRTANTCGASWPIKRRRTCRASGGFGSEPDTQREMLEPEVARAGHPGTAAMEGRRSHRAASTPTTPTPA